MMEPIFHVCRTNYTLQSCGVKRQAEPFETKLYVIGEMSCEGSPGFHTGHLYSFCVCDCFIVVISDLPAGTLEIMYCLQPFLFLQRRPALHTQILLEYNTIVFSLAPLHQRLGWILFSFTAFCSLAIFEL